MGLRPSRQVTRLDFGDDKHPRRMGVRRPAIITSTARLQSELREAGIVPGSETDAMRTVRSCFT